MYVCLYVCMFVWILRNLRATLCNDMEGCAVLVIFNFAHGAIGWKRLAMAAVRRETDHTVCKYVCKYEFFTNETLYECMFASIYVCNMYLYTYEETKVLPCADVVDLAPSEDLRQQTNDWSQWPEKVSRCPILVWNLPQRNNHTFIRIHFFYNIEKHLKYKSYVFI